MRRRGSNPVLIAVLSSLGLLALIGSLWVLDSVQRQTTAGPQQTVKSAPASKVTLANFNKVCDGMTKAQVVNLLGPDYTAVLSVAIPQAKQELLQWDQGDNRVAVVGFADGKVISRSQVRLK